MPIRAVMVVLPINTSEHDLFALASIMVYMIFPVAAFSTLREDFFEKILGTLLEDIGCLEALTGEPVRALKLAGAASALRQKIGAPLPAWARRGARGASKALAFMARTSGKS